MSSFDEDNSGEDRQRNNNNARIHFEDSKNFSGLNDGTLLDLTGSKMPEEIAVDLSPLFLSNGRPFNKNDFINYLSKNDKKSSSDFSGLNPIGFIVESQHETNRSNNQQSQRDRLLSKRSINYKEKKNRHENEDFEANGFNN